jgi:hypothetical protein
LQNEHSDHLRMTLSREQGRLPWWRAGVAATAAPLPSNEKLEQQKERDSTQRGGPKRKALRFLNPNPYSVPLSLLTVRSPFCSLLDRRSYPLT